MNVKKVYNTLLLGIRDYFKKNNFNKAVIGLSGGIDSSVSAKLVADSIGKKNLHALIMPLKGISSGKNVNDAVEFCKLIGINYSLIYIDNFVNEFKKLGWRQNKTAKINLASRIRAVILYNYANSNNALVIGTSNKTEIMLGYFTKYGDGAVDIEVIGDLFKTEVIDLAEFLNIPEKIISKIPSAELYPGQTDEKELGAPYEILDKILRTHVEENLSAKQIIGKGFDKKIVDKVIERIKLNEHKRKSPAIIKVD